MELGNSVVKTSEPDTVTPARTPPPESNQSPFTNGVLKRHAPPHPHYHRHPVVVKYKECLKNHAATIGGHAVDGCGEFMPSPTTLKCDACGCHRNFHRREATEPLHLHLPPPPTLEYQPHHRQHPPSSYMLLALSHPPPDGNLPISGAASAPLPIGNHRKRFRTKFTQNQKDRMLEFAEKIGWKMQQKDEEDQITKFCTEIGVDKAVFKVWMHNNKTTAVKKDPPLTTTGNHNSGSLQNSA